MSWTQVSYLYDGSLAGFFTCVFEAYTHREEPADFTPFDQACASFYAQRSIETDRAKAQRVYRSLEQNWAERARTGCCGVSLPACRTGSCGCGGSSAWGISGPRLYPGPDPSGGRPGTQGSSGPQQ